MMSSAEEKAANVKAIILDVDGVLTDGSLIYNPVGESKTFHVRDGHGVVLARLAGIKTALLTGRKVDVVSRRAKELKIDAVREGIIRKGEALDGLLEELGVTAEEACYAGDDLVDIPVMNRVGFAATVSDAVEDVRAVADWITPSRGGQGAVRELIEFVLKAKGLWQEIVDRHIEERYE